MATLTITVQNGAKRVEITGPLGSSFMDEVYDAASRFIAENPMDLPIPEPAKPKAAETKAETPPTTDAVISKQLEDLMKKAAAEAEKNGKRPGIWETHPWLKPTYINQDWSINEKDIYRLSKINSTQTTL